MKCTGVMLSGKAMVITSQTVASEGTSTFFEADQTLRERRS